MLHYQTVSKLLNDSLQTVMSSDVFADFRLVGGTALSLQLGHRLSIDLDFFSDAEYGSIDFAAIDNFLDNTFSYVDDNRNIPPAMGKSYMVGTDAEQLIKLDVYYTDAFIRPALIADGIRMATPEEITAMKLDVVQRGGRKKDFWDLHELLNYFAIPDMLQLHAERYPYTHDRALIIQNFTDFTLADDDLNPECLRGKYWEFIKDDLETAVAAVKEK